MKRNLRNIVLVSGLLSIGTLNAADKINYEDHVLPILRNKCLKCHNPDKMKADLNLATYDAAINGIDGDAVLVPGSPEESSLYLGVTHDEEPTMPPKDKLPDSEIEVIRKWIAGGLLMNSGSKAMKLSKPKVNLALDPDSLGKRPEGPAPMPVEVFSLDPYVRTTRTSVSTAMAVSPWSPLIAIGGQRQVLLYNTDTFSVAGIVPYEEGYPHSLKFSATGKLLIIGGGRGANIGHSTVWDITKGEKILQVGDDLDVVLASDISPDQRFIAHGGPDRLLRIFSTETGEIVHKIKKHTDWVTAVRFSTDGKYVASGDRNGGLNIWETEPGGRVCSFSHSKRVTGFEWATTNVVVSASMDGSSKIFNVEEARQLKSWGAHSGGAISIARSMNGMLVTSGQNKRATLWDSNGAKKRDFVFPGEVPAQAVPSHDAKLIVGSDWNGDVFVWNAADGKMIKQLSLNPGPMAEQFAAAEKAVTGKAAAAKAAGAAHKAALDRVAKAKADMNALDATLAMRQKAATDSKASLNKLITERQKPSQTKATVAAKTFATAMAAKAAADKALAAADEAGKAAAKAKLDEAMKGLVAATEGKKTADKAAAAINTQVAQLTTVNAAANKGLADAQAKAKTGKAALTKQIADLGKTVSAEQAKVTAAGAALTAAQKEADLLRVKKTFSALYNVRKDITGQETKLSELQAAAQSAQTAAKAAQTQLETAKKTDLKVLKAENLTTLKESVQAKAAAQKALELAKAEVAVEKKKEVAAQKLVASAEAEMKQAANNLKVAQAAKQKADASAKAEAAKLAAAQKSYDQLAAAKLTPIQTITAALDKAMAQSSAAKANAAKASQSIDQEVAAAVKTADKAVAEAKAAGEAAAKAKVVMDKLAAELAKVKADTTAKVKAEATAKATHEQFVVKLKTATEMATKAEVAFKKAPETKVAADNVLKAANTEVKAALSAFLAAEMTAQTAEMSAGNDVAKQVAAKKLRAASDGAKAKLDDLTANKQKPALAKVDQANQNIVATSKAKAVADTNLASTKTATAQALTAFNTATKTRGSAQAAEKTVNDKYVPAQTAYAAAAKMASAKQNVAVQSKNGLASIITTKQKPTQEAVAASAATIKELAAAKTASATVMKQVTADLAIASKPVESAKTDATKATELVKVATVNEAKMAQAMATAQKTVDERKQAMVAVQANIAKMSKEKVKPMEVAMVTAADAMVKAQSIHDNTEKDHQARLVSLTKSVETRKADAKTKQSAMDQFASTVNAAREKLKTLEAEYQKLKAAGAPKKEPTKTASK